MRRDLGDAMNICIHFFDTDQSQDSSGPATLNGLVDLAQALGLPSSKGKNPTSPGLAPRSNPS